MKTLTFILALLCSGCIESSFTIYDRTPIYNVSIGQTDDALTENSYTGFSDDFYTKLDAYISDLLPQIEATGILNNVLFTEPEKFLSQLEVIIDSPTSMTVRGYYRVPATVVIRYEDKMMSIYGHELVRYLLYINGDKHAAFQSSGDWSGFPGILWNLAETTSLKYLPEGL